MVAIGAHVDAADPLTRAASVGARAMQFFLADPQGWKAPAPHPLAAEIIASGLPVYIHAPYVINVATLNNRVRIPSRKLLARHAAAAAALDARGLVVHGGHLTAGDDPATGVDNWRKLFVQADADGGFPVPILIENTAGGANAMARRLDQLARLWDAIGEFSPGFALDTCHAHASGEPREGIVDRVRAITGRIDLVHANNSRDAAGSGADRHANFATGQIDPARLTAIVLEAGCDVIVETPAAGQAEDIALLVAAAAAAAAS
ncbi:MAG: deoxyribonuclease IV [Actinomycetia bacterium]|nr:deoxyribonuclease IV [Actinomycetes bacterium]